MTELVIQSRKRYVLEGEWSGYQSSQQRVVHRVVVKGSRRKFLQWVSQTFEIRYTDGTGLRLAVREAEPREKVRVIDRYGELIWDCFFYRVAGVAELQQARDGYRVLARAGREAGRVIDHIDGDCSNNDLTNLRVVVMKGKATEYDY